MKLYELSKDLALINDEMIDAQGEMSPDLEEQLNNLNLSLVEKATGIRKIIAMIEADASARNAEIERLQNIKKIHENGLERLKNYVKQNMTVAGKTKIETPIGSFTIAKNPASVELNVGGVTFLPMPEGTDAFITPEQAAIEQTPEEYREVIPATWKPNKKKIKETLEQGYDVPGWKLVTNKTNLRIK